ncbi:MAG: site-2 protease family protein [Firmicutes bacterium]|nr:site-2 protease family protein [Bacillota bacterium]
MAYTSKRFIVTIVYIAAAILILMLMITIHELGHYLAAKWTGVKVVEFAIGFGPPIFKRQSKKTGEIFSIRWIPLGGFCAFEGEDAAGAPGMERREKRTIETQSEGISSLVEAEREKTGEFPLAKGMPFDRAHPWRRLVILFSGALFNFASAILFSIVLLMVVGYTQGVRVHDFLDVNSGGQFIITEANTPAQTIKTHQYFQEGDVILAFNGEEFRLLRGFNAVLADLDRSVTHTATIRRGGEVIYQEFNFGQSEDGNSRIGVYMRSADTVFRPMGFFPAIGRAFLFGFELAWLILTFLWMLISGQIGLSGIGGPISTITVMAESVGASFLNILILVPLISVNLAVFNLLPIPALDGARMVFVGIEWGRGRPINPNLEAKIHITGLILLMALVLLADMNFLFFGGRSMIEWFGTWRL